MKTAIVVGAGTSGAIVARRLADAGVEVTLIEAGGCTCLVARSPVDRMR